MGKVMNQKQLDKKLKKWQKKLYLNDWAISAKICRSRDMQGNSAGSVNWNLFDKTAFIRICASEDYPPHTLAQQDMELTLVHELLHIHLGPLHDTFGTGKKEEFYTLFEEQAICPISEALIALERKE